MKACVLVLLRYRPKCLDMIGQLELMELVSILRARTGIRDSCLLNFYGMRKWIIRSASKLRI